MDVVVVVEAVEGTGLLFDCGARTFLAGPCDAAGAVSVAASWYHGLPVPTNTTTATTVQLRLLLRTATGGGQVRACLPVCVNIWVGACVGVPRVTTKHCARAWSPTCSRKYNAP